MLYNPDVNMINLMIMRSDTNEELPTKSQGSLSSLPRSLTHSLIHAHFCPINQPFSPSMWQCCADAHDGAPADSTTAPTPHVPRTTHTALINPRYAARATHYTPRVSFA